MKTSFASSPPSSRDNNNNNNNNNENLDHIKKKRKKNKKKKKNGSLCLYEQVDLDGLNWLIENVDEAMVPEEKTKFLSYVDKIKEGGGGRLVSYSRKYEGKGRANADGSMSIQGFSHNIRNTLAKPLYHDIDMANAHPTILIGLCDRYGIQCKWLKWYIENREEALASIMENAKCSRKKAKILMLIFTYGGTVKTWIEKLKIEEPVQLPHEILKFEEEIRAVGSLIIQKFPHFPIPKKENAEFSKLSLIIQDFEHRMLVTLTEVLARNEYIPGVYVFDGIMVYRKEKGSTCQIETKVLKQCEEELFKKFGFPMKIEEKIIERGYKKIKKNQK